ncbi:three-Cys-motif partner protein TcmP [Candidatus Rariloculus sp.]|uniref:three-Cys-motif partner protein TcmP n=1 Tax=Candidatus Rariloculus sp. TaxID=3101265 RepID=UPI003D0FF762
MAIELDPYKGREQSYVKHFFLTEYLKDAAYKILQGRSPIFNFVDAYAGPWRVSDTENLSDASFDQALQTLEAVRARLGASGKAGLKIRFFFCETRRDAVEELRRYAKQKRRFQIEIFEGSFESNLDNISAACRDGFTFTFIDPSGWNVHLQAVLGFLREQKGEFLLNFMAENINRHADYSVVAKSFGRFLADENWDREFRNLPSDWNNETRIMHLLKNRIKEAGVATYLPEMPILKPLQERVKMRLILGTHKKEGLEVFRNVQARVEREQTAARQQLRNQEQPQASLFSNEELALFEQKLAGVGCPEYKKQAERMIMDILAAQPAAKYGLVACKVLEEIPMRRTHVNQLARGMKQRGIITYDLPPRKQVPKDNTEISLPA